MLGGINSNLAAQNAGAAAATTVIAPAAADPVSAQQAAMFSAYGTLYQQIAAEAQTIQEQYANTLGTSSTTYSSTEAANASQAALSNATLAASPLAAADPSVSSPLDFLSYLLGGPVTTSAPGLGGPLGPSGNFANIVNICAGNWASAGSDLIGLAGGGFLDTSAADAAGGAAAAAGLADTTAPIGSGIAGMGAMPVAAAGQATMVGNLSVPPSWAGSATPVVGTSAAPLQTVGWTAAAPQAGTGTIIPGMPGIGAAARNSAGFGAPRYGVKPIVMPKPTAV
ncbi:PPE family protein, SVP subgroup [Mycobacterium avium]|uniref:PPE family protein, SVP subgroup n=1 Tax=Mycobacterium avium TaxID=1764 RepID=UPI000A016EDD|nr:PE domain-containing protein [Mycobacterium avium]